MRLPLLVALTLAAGLAAGERLPDWPDCVHACNQTQHIYPESGNQERVWPACHHLRRAQGDGADSVGSDLVDSSPTASRTAGTAKWYASESVGT